METLLNASAQERESWMCKDAEVVARHLPGTITTVVTTKWEGKEMVLTIYVRLNGTETPVPFNPDDVKQATKDGTDSR